jgi:hypothetical protein
MDQLPISTMDYGFISELSPTRYTFYDGFDFNSFVLMKNGPGRENITCSHRDGSVLYISIGATAHTAERIFASGNERTSLIFSNMGAKDVGYKMNALDKLGSTLELMNENKEDATAWITITWDYVEGYPFKDDVKVVWFDARQCGTSEVNPPVGQSRFQIGWTWNSTVDAEVLGIGGSYKFVTHVPYLSADTLSKSSPRGRKQCPIYGRWTTNL